jgi:hypothetical protein
MSLGFFSGSISIIAKIFLGFDSFLFLGNNIVKKYSKKIKSISFVGFKLILNSQHLLKQSWSLSKCVSMSLQALKSSINNFMKLSKYSLEAVLTFF